MICVEFTISDIRPRPSSGGSHDALCFICSTSVMQIQDLVDTQRFSHESTKFILDKSSRICMFHPLNIFYTTRGPMRFSMFLLDTGFPVDSGINR